MEKNKAKYDCKIRLFASLQEFSGPVPAGFFNHKEFFIVSINRVAANLLDFKHEALRALCANLLARMRRGPLSSDQVEQFKERLAGLVSVRDLQVAVSSLAGSKEFVAGRLARLQPLAIAEEERKRHGEPRDPAADRLVTETYARLHFDALEEELRKGKPLEEVLEKARSRIGDYCALNRLPALPEDTIPPVSLSCVEAVTGACVRLLGKLPGGEAGASE